MSVTNGEKSPINSYCSCKPKNGILTLNVEKIHVSAFFLAPFVYMNNVIIIGTSFSMDNKI